jgi:outer membrane immunogenic protein
MLSIKGFAVVGLVVGMAGVAASAAAQTDASAGGLSRAQVAVGYSYMRANAAPGSCGCFSLNGGNAEVGLRVYRNLSAVFDFTGEYAGTTSIAGQSLALLSYTAGPRFSYSLHRMGRVRTIPFVQALVGSVHGFDGQFPDHSGSLVTSADALALLAGGGVDLDFGRRLGIRLVQIDYGLNQLPNNANNNQNLLRVSAGVVLRIP